MIEYHYFELTKVIKIANQSKRKDQREEMGTQSEKKKRKKKRENAGDALAIGFSFALTHCENGANILDQSQSIGKIAATFRHSLEK